MHRFQRDQKERALLAAGIRARIPSLLSWQLRMNVDPRYLKRDILPTANIAYLVYCIPS